MPGLPEKPRPSANAGLSAEPRLYCIDASIYIFRAWFSYPERWFSPEGYSLNAVYGYLQFLLKLLQRTDPAHLMAAFDESLGSGFRHRLYPGYKSNRALPDEALAFQLGACRELTEALGIACYGGDEYEADDYIAAAARLAQQGGKAVTVVTRDKDLAQVLNGDDDRWWDFSGDREVSPAQWLESSGVRCDQLADWLALTGDSIDAIPGVPGVGAVTAARLLQQFDSLDAIYADLSLVAASGIRGAARLGEKLREHREQVQLARQLTGLCSDIDEVDSLDAMRFAYPQREQLQCCLLRLGFDAGWCRQLINRPPLNVAAVGAEP